MDNEVLSLGRDGTNRDYIDSGQARTNRQIFGWILFEKTDGIFKTQEQIDNYVTSTGTPIMIEGKRPQLGDVKYLDLNDDGEITDADVIIAVVPGTKNANVVGIECRVEELRFQYDVERSIWQ